MLNTLAFKETKDPRKPEPPVKEPPSDPRQPKGPPVKEPPEDPTLLCGLNLQK